jgi:hypothetical protein
MTSSRRLGNGKADGSLRCTHQLASGFEFAQSKLAMHQCIDAHSTAEAMRLTWLLL